MVDEYFVLTHAYPNEDDELRGKFFEPFITSLTSRGCNVTVITPTWSETGGTSISSGNCGERVIRFQFSSPFLGDPGLGLLKKVLLTILLSLSFVRVTRLHLYGENCTLIACWAMPAGVALKLLRSRRKIVWWLGSDFHQVENLKLSTLIFKFLTGPGIENWTNSKRIQSSLGKISRRRIFFAPLSPQEHLFSSSHLHNKTNDKRICKPLNKTPKTLKMISVGRLEPVKGHDRIIDVLLKSPKLASQIHYKIVGTGSFMPRLQQEAKSLSNVEFCGKVDNQELRQLYEWCDVVVQPSRDEGMPLVLFEALNFGRPVICSTAGDLRYLCDSPDTVYCFETPTQLKSILRKFIGGKSHFDKDYAEMIVKQYDNKVTTELALGIIEDAL